MILETRVDRAAPEFGQNRLIYLSYSEASQGGAQPDAGDPRFGEAVDNTDDRVMGGAVMRATLDGYRLTDPQVIWRQEPKTIGRGHFGHRLVFSRDGTLFITSGERMRFDPAQSLESTLGKVVRINRDGTVPKDNPFADKPGVPGEILRPRATWNDPTAYDAAARRLAQLFVENFKQYESGAGAEMRGAGPSV